MIPQLIFRRSLTLASLLFFLSAPLAAQETQKFASLGDFRLESGEVIRGFKIGYRTFGELNAEKSNAILFPTWFTGTTKDLVKYVGPGKLADSSKYYVILVDSIGDGVTSSPSNSTLQPHMQFPRFTIRDMVESEYQLLTRILGLNHLHAVMGISMGGIQTFQWIVSYPAFMDKAVPMVGTPQLTSYDLLLWQAELHAIEADRSWNNGEYLKPPAAALKTVADIHSLALTTPADRVSHTSRAEFPKFLGTIEQQAGFDANDRVRQLQAIMDHDVAARFGGSMEKAAAAVRAQVLVVAGKQDHMVNPQPALAFARLLSTPAVELDSDCGHLALACEETYLIPVIAAFLEK